MTQICFATNNRHKLEEVRAMLSDSFRVISLEELGCTEDLEETQDTMEGNALQKANYIFNKYKVPCFADDSGLEVESLGGAPGVYSARYAGPQRSDSDNIRRLLDELAGKKDRRARFRTVIALLGVAPDPLVFEGTVEGTIVEEKRGSNGFGYDPVFMPSGYDKTFGELDAEVKNKISHRAIAVQKLVSYLGSDR